MLYWRENTLTYTSVLGCSCPIKGIYTFEPSKYVHHGKLRLTWEAFPPLIAERREINFAQSGGSRTAWSAKALKHVMVTTGLSITHNGPCRKFSFFVYEKYFTYTKNKVPLLPLP